MVDTILRREAKAKRMPSSTKAWSHIFCDAMVMLHKTEMRENELIKEVERFSNVHHIDKTRLLNALIRRGVVRPLGRGWLELIYSDD